MRRTLNDYNPAATLMQNFCKLSQSYMRLRSFNATVQLEIEIYRVEQKRGQRTCIYCNRMRTTTALFWFYPSRRQIACFLYLSVNTRPIYTSTSMEILGKLQYFYCLNPLTKFRCSILYSLHISNIFNAYFNIAVLV